MADRLVGGACKASPRSRNATTASESRTTATRRAGRLRARAGCRRYRGSRSSGRSARRRASGRPGRLPRLRPAGCPQAQGRLGNGAAGIVTWCLLDTLVWFFTFSGIGKDYSIPVGTPGSLDGVRCARARACPIRRLLLLVLGALALAVVVLNWTYGRLPAEPAPTGSFVQVGDLRIRYIEHRGAGVPVVLIHGLPGTAEDREDVTPCSQATARSRSTAPAMASPAAGMCRSTVSSKRFTNCSRSCMSGGRPGRPFLWRDDLTRIRRALSEQVPSSRAVDAAAAGQQIEGLAEVQATQPNFSIFRSSGRSPTRLSASSSQRSR